MKSPKEKIKPRLHVELPVAIGDRVYIPELERPGVLNAVLIYRNEIYYKIRYFCDGQPQEVLFTFDEFQIK